MEAAVFSDGQERVPDTAVVLVPDIPRRQRSDAYRMARSDASGNVRFEGVPPGEYRLFAWDTVEDGAWQNPDFIREFESQGQPVTIGPRSRETAIVNPLDD